MELAKGCATDGSDSSHGPDRRDGPGHLAGARLHRETALAKVNLFLAVGPRRADGYHELLTLFESIPLGDDVEVSISPGAPEAGWIYRARATVPPTSPGLELPVDLDNLAGLAAFRFVREMLHRSGAEGAAGADSISVSITKRIPVAAGLGGGSSDAAAVLRALDAHYGHPLPAARLRAVAADLGADVAFFLEKGRAIGRSRGESLEPVAGGRPVPLVLGLPSFPLRTADVYRRLDELRAATPALPADRTGGRAGARVGDGAGDWANAPRDLAALAECLAAGRLDEAAPLLRNDLEAPALDLCPGLDDALGALCQAGCLTARMSGSGPTVFGLASSLPRAKEAARLAPGCLPPSLRGKITFVAVLSAPEPSSRPAS